MKMNPVAKRKWIAALMSGKFKQGFNRLRGLNDYGMAVHCCFGVLQEVVPLGVGDNPW